MLKGIYEGCFPAGMALDDKFHLAKELGFDGVEVAGTEELVGSDEKLRSLAELSKSTVKVSSIMAQAGWRNSPASPDPDERAKGMDLLAKTIRAAKMLSADTILVIPAVVSDKVTYVEAWERGQKAMRDLAKVAEEYGVYLGVENVWNKFLLSPLEMRQFIDDVKHPLVQAYFDVGNVLTFGYPEQWIEVLGSRIKKVHVKDYRTAIGGGAGFTPMLLEGDVNWPAVMAGLRKIGYTSYLTAEVGTYKYFGRKGVYDISTSIDEILKC